MILVRFLGPLDFEDLKIEAKSLRELKERLSQYDESELKKWLELCAVSVNDEIVSNLDTQLNDGDIVALLPPVCGG
ncbi:MAG: MoaD/ThiS family protein [Campylobacter sp.]|nr:MoaD/ThiS family protein [Campylobacter sp.]